MHGRYAQVAGAADVRVGYAPEFAGEELAGAGLGTVWSVRARSGRHARQRSDRVTIHDVRLCDAEGRLVCPNLEVACKSNFN
jgi:hypothetical protein